MLPNDRMISVENETRELARELHWAAHTTIKGVIHMALVEYARNHGYAVTNS